MKDVEFQVKVQNRFLTEELSDATKIAKEHNRGEETRGNMQLAFPALQLDVKCMITFLLLLKLQIW